MRINPLRWSRRMAWARARRARITGDDSCSARARTVSGMVLRDGFNMASRLPAGLEVNYRVTGWPRLAIIAVQCAPAAIFIDSCAKRKRRRRAAVQVEMQIRL